MYQKKNILYILLALYSCAVQASSSPNVLNTKNRFFPTWNIFRPSFLKNAWKSSDLKVKMGIALTGITLISVFLKAAHALCQISRKPHWKWEDFKKAFWGLNLRLDLFAPPNPKEKSGAPASKRKEEDKGKSSDTRNVEKIRGAWRKYREKKNKSKERKKNTVTEDVSALIGFMHQNVQECRVKALGNPDTKDGFDAYIVTFEGDGESVTKLISKAQWEFFQDLFENTDKEGIYKYKEDAHIFAIGSWRDDQLKKFFGAVEKGALSKEEVLSFLDLDDTLIVADKPNDTYHIIEGAKDGIQTLRKKATVVGCTSTPVNIKTFDKDLNREVREISSKNFDKNFEDKYEGRFLSFYNVGGNDSTFTCVESRNIFADPSKFSQDSFAKSKGDGKVLFHRGGKEDPVTLNNKAFFFDVGSRIGGKITKGLGKKEIGIELDTFEEEYAQDLQKYFIQSFMPLAAKGSGVNTEYSGMPFVFSHACLSHPGSFKGSIIACSPYISKGLALQGMLEHNTQTKESRKKIKAIVMIDDYYMHLKLAKEAVDKYNTENPTSQVLFIGFYGLGWGEPVKGK